MDDLSDRLRRLGAAVAGVSDLRTAVADGAAERARRAFLDGSARTRSPRWGRAWIPAVAACVALAGVGVRLAATSLPSSRTEPNRVAAIDAGGAEAPPASLSFLVGDDRGDRPGAVGEWLAAGSDAPLSARFSDGSAVELAPGASMRVSATTPVGADVLLERGTLHATVAHPAGVPARWAVRAGPFEVRVTGTRFDASWDPQAEAFELTLVEGRVTVTGPSLPADRAVVAGEHLVVSLREARTVLGAARAQAAPLVAGGARPSWKELVAKGRYRDAFAAAEAAGIAQEMERAPAGNLLLLADAARFSASPARAREALLLARRRFGARGQSAFLLGKIAADQQGSPGDAAAWFETYLREEPGGPFAEEARRRLAAVVDGGGG